MSRVSSSKSKSILTTGPKVVHCKNSSYDVYIGRPGPWGNPFVIGRDGDRAAVIRKFREFLIADKKLIEAARRELKGKVLACWCSPLACHGDVLMEIANSENEILNENIQVKNSEQTKENNLNSNLIFNSSTVTNENVSTLESNSNSNNSTSSNIPEIKLSAAQKRRLRAKKLKQENS